MTATIRTAASATDLSKLAEPELDVWATQAVVAKPDTPLVRFGAIAFWTIVAGLLVARVLFVDVAKLRPEASATAAPTPPIAIQTSAPKV